MHKNTADAMLSLCTKQIKAIVEKHQVYPMESVEPYLVTVNWSWHLLYNFISFSYLYGGIFISSLYKGESFLPWSTLGQALSWTDGITFDSMKGSPVSWLLNKPKLWGFPHHTVHTFLLLIYLFIVPDILWFIQVQLYLPT